MEDYQIEELIQTLYYNNRYASGSSVYFLSEVFPSSKVEKIDYNDMVEPIIATATLANTAVLHLEDYELSDFALVTRL